MATLIERKFAGRTLNLETGRLARQADGAVLVQFGETVILATVVAETKGEKLRGRENSRRVLQARGSTG